jgi:peptidyl-prolyl cis-trans isomerase B (cyclophilin B)
VLLVASCGGRHGRSASARDCASVSQPPAEQRTRNAPTAALDPAKTYELVVETNCGSFTIRLDPSRSPQAAASLVALARSRYFDRTIFTGIVPGVMIEAGDPTATGTGGPGYTTVDPPPPSLDYTHGVVAMERPTGAAPGAAGSRFFIVTAGDARRPPNDAVVGKVVAGLDVVDLIGTFGIQNDLSDEVSHINGLPSRVLEIERVKVVVGSP